MSLHTPCQNMIDATAKCHCLPGAACHHQDIILQNERHLTTLLADTLMIRMLPYQSAILSLTSCGSDGPAVEHQQKL